MIRQTIANADRKYRGLAFSAGLPLLDVAAGLIVSVRTNASYTPTMQLTASDRLRQNSKDRHSVRSVGWTFESITTLHCVQRMVGGGGTSR